MSIQYHSTPENAQATWKALCAKNGLPEAANIGPHVGSLTNADLHELRKTTRRAVNQITSSALYPELFHTCGRRSKNAEFQPVSKC